jgi:hypothetical protein
MTDSGHLGFPPSRGGPGLPPPAAGPPSWPPSPPAAFRRPSQWPTISALAIAILAIAIGAVGWFRPVQREFRSPTPSTPSTPAYTEQQISDAKNSICTAYSTAKSEVSFNTNRPNPAEGDELSTLAYATSARLGIIVAATYLLNQLAINPAIPNNLADSVRSLANSYEEFAVRALNNEPSNALDPLRNKVDADIATIDQLCK